MLKIIVAALVCLSCTCAFSQSKELLIPYGHDFVILDLAFTPNGKKMVSVGKNGEAFVWDLNSKLPLRKLSGYRWDIWSAEFLNDSICLTGGEEGKLYYHNIYTGKHEAQEGFGEYDVIMAFAIDPSGKYLSALCLIDSPEENSFLIRTVELKKRKVVFEEKLEHYNLRNGADGSISAFMDMKFSPDGKFLVTTDNSYLFTWKFNPKNGSLTQYNFGEEIHNARNINFFPDGRLELITENEESNYLNLENWEMEPTNFTENVGGVSELILSRNEMVRVNETQLKIFDLASGSLSSTIETEQKVIIGVKYNPELDQLFSFDMNGHIYSWNPNTGRRIAAYESKNGDVTKISFSSNNDLLITGHQDNRLRFWDLNKMELTRSIVAGRFDFSEWEHKHGIIGMDLNSKEGIIACTSDATNIWLYDYNSGLLKDSIPVEDVPSDIKLYLKKDLVIANTYGEIVMIHISSGEKVMSLDKNMYYNQHSGYYEVVFPKSYFTIDTLTDVLYIGNSDGANDLLGISLITMDTVYYTYQSHEEEITSVNFDPEQQFLITTSRDKSIQLWNVKDGSNEPFMSYTLPSELNLSEYIAEENMLYVLSEDDSLRMLQISDNEITLLKTVFEPHGIDMKQHEFKDFLFIGSANNYVSVRRKSNLEPIGKMVAIDENSYFIMDQKGYYKSDKNSLSKVGFLINREVVSALQFDIQMNRPDQVITAFDSSKDNLKELYYNAYLKRLKKLNLSESDFEKEASVPTAKFTGIEKLKPEQFKSELEVHIKASDLKQNLDRFNIWINEVPVFGANGFSLKDRNSKSFDTLIVLQLMEGENKIETSVTNRNAIESLRSPIYVKYTPESAYVPKTYFIGIGIDKFKEPNHNLKYAVKDVRDLAKSLKEKLGENLVIDTLFNENVNVSNVTALKSRIMNTNINDKVIIAYSGHGLLNKEYDYFLSAYNVEFKNPDIGGIPYEVLEDLLDSIPARKKLLLIDACHSGELDKDELVIATENSSGNKEGEKNDGASKVKMKLGKTGSKNSFIVMQELFVNVQKGSGATIISAAGGDQSALEGGGKLQNGYFTYAILEYMRTHDEVAINALKKYVCEEVERLSNGSQKPTSRIENLEMDWQVW